MGKIIYPRMEKISILSIAIVSMIIFFSPHPLAFAQEQLDPISTENSTDKEAHKEPEPSSDPKPLITFSIDKKNYTDGETILVSGEVIDILAGFQADLRVIAANNNLVTTQRLDINSDKKFSTEIIADGSLWKSSGTYTIKILYGTELRSAEAMFNFTSIDTSATEPEPLPSLAHVIISEGTSVHGCEDSDECYNPSIVRVGVEGEVTWHNDDTTVHTITSGHPDYGPDAHFDSAFILSGNTFSVKFDFFKIGDYPYHCMLHPWMHGVVLVGDFDYKRKQIPATPPEPEPESYESEFTVFVDQIEDHSRAKTVYIKGYDSIPSNRIEITILSEDNKIFDELAIFSTKAGEFSTMWMIDDNISPGTYTIKASDHFDETKTTFTIGR